MAAAPRQSPSAPVTRGAGHGCVIAFAVLYGVGFGGCDCLAPSACLTWGVWYCLVFIVWYILRFCCGYLVSVLWWLVFCTVRVAVSCIFCCRSRHLYAVLACMHRAVCTLTELYILYFMYCVRCLLLCGMVFIVCPSNDLVCSLHFVSYCSFYCM